MNRTFHRYGLSATLALALAGLAGTLPSSAVAYDLESTSSINVEAGTLMLHGYDPVSYFTGDQPLRGMGKFIATHDGATYSFATRANLVAFQTNPDRYVPQFGGFCAMGAALGKKLDVDPTQFKIVDGKLYLNINADAFQMWSADVPGNIAKANANWPVIKDKAPSSL